MSSESTCFQLQHVLLSSPERVPRLSYPFRRNFGRSGKGSFTEKAKIVNRGSQCSPRESTCSKLQYDPYLISVASSYTELSIQRKFRRYGKGSYSEKAKNFTSGFLIMPSECTCFWLQYNPYLISVVCSYTVLSISVRFGT